MEQIVMSKVIEGKKYDTETAECVASNVYWDGHNFERNGRNTWLYKTPLGAFFQVNGTFWQGERDTLIPLSQAEAMALYESLSEQEKTYEETFGIAPEEPEPSPGRPPLYGEKMTQTAIWLPREMIAWLKDQPGSISETLRDMIQQQMAE